MKLDKEKIMDFTLAFMLCVLVMNLVIIVMI